MKLPWDISYSPVSLDAYVFNDPHAQQYITSLTTIPHLLFYGEPGTGKTTLAELLIAHHGVDELDTLRINASDDNNVDTIRERVKSFISTASFGEYKVVLLDEADYLSKAAQAVLRGLILEYTDTARFILTCNYVHQIMPALQSRCEQFKIQATDRYDIIELVVRILIKENIKFDLDTVEYYVNICYPDIRRTIKCVQQNCIDGVLILTKPPTFNVIEYLTDNKWRQLRADLALQQDIDYDGIYTSLYQNLQLCAKFKDDDKYESGVVIIADYLSKSGMNPLITLIACIIELSRV